MAYGAHGKHRKHYVHLAIMTARMFAVMCAMVDRFAIVYSSLNQIYMAGLMTAPMVLIELAVMRSTFGDRRCDRAVAGAVLSAARVAQRGMHDRRGTPARPRP